MGVWVSVQHKQDRKGVAQKAASLHQSLRSDGGVNMASAHTLKGQLNCTQGNSHGKRLLETGPAPYSFQTARFLDSVKARSRSNGGTGEKEEGIYATGWFSSYCDSLLWNMCLLLPCDPCCVMYMLIWMCHICVPVWRGQRSRWMAGVFSWLLFIFIFETGSYREPKAHLFSYAFWPMSIRDPPVSIPPNPPLHCYGYRRVSTCLTLCMEIWTQVCIVGSSIYFSR